MRWSTDAGCCLLFSFFLSFHWLLCVCVLCFCLLFRLLNLYRSYRSSCWSFQSSHWFPGIRFSLTGFKFWWWSSNSTSIPRSWSYHVRVNGTGYAIFHLHVKFRYDINIVHTRIFQIALSSSLNHVTNNNTLNGFIFWGAATTVWTSDWLYGTTILSVLATITSFLGHGKKEREEKQQEAQRKKREREKGSAKHSTAEKLSFWPAPPAHPQRSPRAATPRHRDAGQACPLQHRPL